MESTVNRVGDRVFEQLDRTGHAQRLDDLDRIVALGATAVRYPVLWERTAPNGVDHADWRWPDERLARLQTLRIAPIVGLVHHGNGPRSTSLIDPDFPTKLAQYARAVAERYPWVTQYTPVNEPLTTARFSGLYGHWYPHGRDDHMFARVLVTQCHAVALAMQAIREVNPAAQLVQTDDLGKTYSTNTLQYQAGFENERRWLSWDLLCGRVTPHHPLWNYLRHAGIAEADLWWFCEQPCPPDLIGVDYYLSSERFLDERTEQYPPDTHGGNHRHRYADVLAARVRIAGFAGPGALLREAWERYGIPVALTEAHNGCTREEQLRWLVDVWQAANDVRRDGVDVRAVTAWALFGAYDWDSLVTRDAGHYEPGAWDVRGPAPRPTAIVGLLQDLASGREPDHPVLGTPGWWQQPTLFIYGIAIDDAAAEAPRVPLPGRASAAHTTGAPRPLVITGATGTLGKAFARLCELRGLPYRLLSRQEMNIAQGAGVAAVLQALHPWAVVNTAGYVHVDEAERDGNTCVRSNAEGAAVLAAACAEHSVPLLTFSSDLVFDGRQTTPYVESDPVAPLGVYGRSKVLAEQHVLEMLPSALVVRTSGFFGPWDQYNFLTGALRTLAAGQRVTAAGDVVVSPTYVPDLVHAALDLLIDGERGVWHLANVGAVSWAELARRGAVLAGFDPAQVNEQSSVTLGWTAPRPRYSVLGSERGQLLPSLDDALVRYAQAYELV